MNSAVHEQLISTLKKAGKRALELRNKGLNIQIKPDGSKVTNADHELNDFLSDKVNDLFPGEHIIGEESEHHHQIEGASHTWFIDPIDGTSNFINNSDYFFILLGRAIDGVPVNGYIYQPFFDRLICTTPDEFIADIKANQSSRFSPIPDWAHRATNAISLKRFTESERDDFLRLVNGEKASYFYKWPGALALLFDHSCAYLSFRPTHYWDTCAIAAVLSKLGADIQFYDKHGEVTDFNHGIKSHALSYTLKNAPDEMRDWFEEQIQNRT